jgi:AcrR family transcriptional regulator
MTYSDIGTMTYRCRLLHGTISYLKQVKMSEIKKPKPRSPLSHVQSKPVPIRERVLKAAFSLFREHGFSSTSMLEIVTRARVSKRDLYALFKNKHAVLAACISERAQQMRRPLEATILVPQTRDALAALLVAFGVSILKTVCHPEVLTVFRLAIAESDRAPEIARTLHDSGREANQKALAELLRKAQAQGLVLAGDPAVLVDRYLALLWGDLLIRLLMRVREAPTEREIEVRARAATETLMALPL